MAVQKSTKTRRWSGRTPSRPVERGGHGSRLLEILVIVATVLAVIAILAPLRRETRNALAAPAPAASAPASLLTGTAVVIDGDTLDLGPARIRLHGIDAFERDQHCGNRDCGRIAKSALDTLVRNQPMTCEVRDTDRNGRLVSICRVGDTDVGAWMVARGHAVAYRRYSDDYTDEEVAARGRRAGAWAGTFDEPETWRQAH